MNQPTGGGVALIFSTVQKMLSKFYGCFVSQMDE